MKHRVMRYEMRGSLALVACVVGIAVWFGASSRVTHAETFSAAAGQQNFGIDECFRWVEGTSGAVGVQRLSTSGCEFQSFVVPLYWKNFYSSGTNRTVNVRGRRNSSSAQLSCTLFVIDQNGLVASQATGSLTTVGDYSLLPLVVNNVSSTTTSFLACTMTAQNTYLMNIQYSP